MTSEIEVQDARDTGGGAYAWALIVALAAGAVLALARFITYLATVFRVDDVPFHHALTWWSIYAVGVGLLVRGALGVRGDDETPLFDVLALLVGLLVLVLMPPAPAARFAGLGF